jgi:peptidoglycan/xylan/chitin deacetylase (PgdA/CDA1 family)
MRHSEPPVTALDYLPSPFLKGSLALHGLAGAALAIEASAWPWALGSLALNHLAISSAGLIPRGALLGPNIVRLPEASASTGQVALTIDDGPDPEVTPATLDILEAHDVRATFFCVGRALLAHPSLARDIIRRGHAIENHSLNHHDYFSLLGPQRMAREVREGQRVIGDITGEQPRFFRAPAGLRNPFLQPILARHGLQLCSWTRRGFDTACREPSRVQQRLTRGLRGGDILLLHDGRAARTRSGLPIILEVLPRLLETLRQTGLRTVLLRDAIALPPSGPLSSPSSSSSSLPVRPPL